MCEEAGLCLDKFNMMTIEKTGILIARDGLLARQ